MEIYLVVTWYRRVEVLYFQARVATINIKKIAEFSQKKERAKQWVMFFSTKYGN